MTTSLPEKIDIIIAGIKEQTDLAVIGLSGGADSTLVACLCRHALGSDRVYGISMPYGETDKKTFNSRSESLALKLGIHHKTLEIREAFTGVSNKFELSTLNAGNLRSRLRMIFLYTHCCEVGESLPGLRARVIGTGNLSEDYIGYDTKGGDALADFFPIGQLYKSEVYAMLEYYRDLGVISEEHIDRVPSAGLWEGQTDEAELGYTYNEMAPAIDLLIKLQKKGPESEIPGHIEQLKEGSFKELVNFVWKRHIVNRHKHQAPPSINLGRSY